MNTHQQPIKGKTLTFEWDTRVNIWHRSYIEVPMEDYMKEGVIDWDSIVEDIADHTLEHQASEYIYETAEEDGGEELSYNGTLIYVNGQAHHDKHVLKALGYDSEDN
jgi:hypothetical protein